MLTSLIFEHWHGSNNREKGFKNRLVVSLLFFLNSKRYHRIRKKFMWFNCRHRRLIADHVKEKSLIATLHRFIFSGMFSLHSVQMAFCRLTAVEIIPRSSFKWPFVKISLKGKPKGNLMLACWRTLTFRGNFTL